jgi:hypothetical protein
VRLSQIDLAYSLAGNDLAKWSGQGCFDATRYQDDSGMVHGRTMEQQNTPAQTNTAATHPPTQPHF